MSAHLDRQRMRTLVENLEKSLKQDKSSHRANVALNTVSILLNIVVITLLVL